MTRRVGWLLLATLAIACSGDSDGGGAGTAGGDATGGTTGATDGSSASGGAGGTTGGTTGTGSGGLGATDGGVPSGGGTGGSFPTGIVDGGVLVPEELQALCGGPCQCSDGIDNDGDGVADGFDSECTGPADNDEGSFATGISGDNRDPKWQDCFFDGNSGAGDDDCRYATGCLTGDLEQSDPDCTVSQMCVDYCTGRTPPGCDCFGCCEFTLDDGSTISVVLEAGCSEEALDQCTECIVSTGECSNECGECELCLGKTIDDLPDSCFENPPTGGTGGSGGSGGTGGSGGSGGAGGSDDPPPYTCDGGVPTCASTADCTAGRYCSFGCCQVILF